MKILFLTLALIGATSPLIARAESEDFLNDPKKSETSEDVLGDNQVLFHQDNGYGSCMKDCQPAHSKKWCDYQCTMVMENQN